MKSRGKSRLFVYNRYIRRKAIRMNSAKFYKVSYEQFQMGMEKEDVKDIYDAIKLPRRATKGSAGYDFYTPINIHLEPGETVKIPTGIRCEMNER